MAALLWITSPLKKKPNEMSTVRSTNTTEGAIIRRRICYNDHSFNTKEVAISPVKNKRIYNTTPKPR